MAESRHGGEGGSPSYDSALLDAVASLKSELQSPTGIGNFNFQRSSSLGSAAGFSCSSASSAQNTDDEDSDGTTGKQATGKDRRREAHTHAEQKRRDSIKKGYEDLTCLVPTCQQPDSISSQKLSKAAVLQKSIDYMQFLLAEKKKKEEELENLRREVTALRIMKTNYEQIVQAHQNTPQVGLNQVTDEIKFQVFQQLMDVLFHSFNNSVSVSNFQELSACIFNWMEEHCKPQILREVTVNILQQTSSQMHN